MFSPILKIQQDFMSLPDMNDQTTLTNVTVSQENHKYVICHMIKCISLSRESCNINIVNIETCLPVSEMHPTVANSVRKYNTNIHITERVA